MLYGYVLNVIEICCISDGYLKDTSNCWIFDGYTCIVGTVCSGLYTNSYHFLCYCQVL